MQNSKTTAVKVVLSRTVSGMDDVLCVLEVGGEPARVGRDEDCALRIMDRSVSRQQAELRMTEDGDLIVVDSGSLNGTRLNQDLVSRRPIHLVLAGDVLRFGYANEIRVVKVMADTQPVEGDRARWGAVA